jgi:hypothetical protein
MGKNIMRKKMIGLALCVAAFQMNLAAQTELTTISLSIPVVYGAERDYLLATLPTSNNGTGDAVYIQVTGITTGYSEVGVLTVAMGQRGGFWYVKNLEGSGGYPGVLIRSYLQSDGTTNIYAVAPAYSFDTTYITYFQYGWGATLYNPAAQGAWTGTTLNFDSSNDSAYPINSSLTFENGYFTGNVGIGTTTPAAGLDVANGILHVSGTVNPTTTVQGTYLGWNSLTGSWGETDLINNPGLGYGGFAFMEVPSSGSPRSTLMYLTGAGNLGIGTTSPGAKLEVDGSVKLTAGSGASITFQDGTVQSSAFTGVLCGGDYAESVDVTGDRKSYAAGDVLVIDPNDSGKFLKSAEPYSSAVLGIYSTKPGAVGRRQLTPKNDDEVPMAMIGIVPTKVTAENGAIKPGDLLVTSSTPGYAMLGTDRSRLVGAIIGKAMGRLDSGKGVIEVGVTLQ